MNYKKLLLACAMFVSCLVVLVTSPNHYRQSASGTIILEMENAQMEMDLEQFIPLVLMAEMPYESPGELLKAQAVVIRTNILHTMDGNKVMKAREIGLPYKTPSQLKQLWFQEEKMFRANKVSGMVANFSGLGEGEIYTKKMKELKEIVGETEGRVLKIEGKLILPLFHRLSNGKTRGGKETIGDDFSYLKEVECSMDMEASGYTQYQEFGVPEIFEKLKQHGIVIYQKGDEMDTISAETFVKQYQETKKEQQGYLCCFCLGDVQIDGMDFADALGLSSPAMDVTWEAEKVRFTTRGCGHGFGMSLNEAGNMARKGMKYDKILKTFYDAALVKNIE
jgi:stage II sporulation protein D